MTHILSTPLAFIIIFLFNTTLLLINPETDFISNLGSWITLAVVSLIHYRRILYEVIRTVTLFSNSKKFIKELEDDFKGHPLNDLKKNDD